MMIIKGAIKKSCLASQLHRILLNFICVVANRSAPAPSQKTKKPNNK